MLRRLLACLLLLCLAASPAVAGISMGGGSGGGGGDASTSNPLSQFASTTSAQLAGVLSNETGSGASVFGTSPTFTTDIRTPLVIGSTASGGDLTLQSTTHATKGTVFFGTSGTTVYDEVNNRLGIGTASPLVKFQVSEGPSVTSAAHILYSQDNDYGGGAGAAVGLNLQTYYTARNTGSPFNPTHAVAFSKLYYGLKNDQATLESTAIGTTTNEGLHTVIYAQGDQESEVTGLYAGVRFNIGTGYSPSGTFAGNDLGQTAGPAGSLFAILDLNAKGPIAVQPGLLNGVSVYLNNYYNGQPSRGSQESGAFWALTGFSHGGENDALHAAATTYPIAIGYGCAGTSGSAVPGAGRGFETCFRAGGKAGQWGAAGVLDTSIIGVGYEARDYNLYGIYLHDNISSAPAIYVTDTGGNSGFGTTASSIVRLQASLTSNSNGAAGLKGLITHSTAAAGTIQVGVYGTATAAHTSGSHGREYGVLGQAFHTQGGTSAWIVGGAFEASTSGTGGTITDLVSTLVLANTVGGSTTVTRNTGLYISAQSGGTTAYGLYSVHTGNHLLAGNLQIGSTTQLTLTQGALGMAKITASGSAPGASGAKIEFVCGTGAGTGKLQAYAGTSTTPVTILDNIGAGVTGC